MASVEGKVDAAKAAPVPATPAASSGSTSDDAESEMKELKTEQKELVNEAHQTAAMPEGPDKDAKKKELLDEAAKLDNKMASVEGKVDAAKAAPVPATPAASSGSTSDDAKATTLDKPTTDSSGGLKDEMKLLEDLKAKVAKLASGSTKDAAQKAISEAESKVGEAEKLKTDAAKLKDAQNTLVMTAHRVRKLPDGKLKNEKKAEVLAEAGKLDAALASTTQKQQAATDAVATAIKKLVE